MKKILLWLIAIISVIFGTSSSFAEGTYTLEIDYPSTMYFSQTYDVTFTSSVPLDSSIVGQTFNLDYGGVFEFNSIDATNQILYIRYTTPPASKMSEVSGINCEQDPFNDMCLAMNDYVFYPDMHITPLGGETLTGTNQMNIYIQLSPENMPTGSPMLNGKSVVDEMKVWETNNEVQTNRLTLILTIISLSTLLITMFFGNKIFSFLKKVLSGKK